MPQVVTNTPLRVVNVAASEVVVYVTVFVFINVLFCAKLSKIENFQALRIHFFTYVLLLFFYYFIRLK